MQQNDLSRSLVAFDQNSTLVTVVELSARSWLVAGLVPGVERQPLKKLGSDPQMLLAQLNHWHDEAERAGASVKRIVLAYEAGRDGFWLARWLRAHGIETYVMHPSSIAVSREHRRAKTDRIDTQLQMRSFLGWLRGEAKHCSMAAIPNLAEEDARCAGREHERLVRERTRVVNQMKALLVRLGITDFNVKLKKAAQQVATLRTPQGEPLPPNMLAELRRDMVRLQLIKEQIKAIEQERRQRLERAPQEGAHPQVLMLARVKGVGIETADMLVHEHLARKLRDRKAVARYAGLTGAPDESGSRRREKGLARAGNPRVRHAMIELAWRWLMFQKQSALTQWYKARAANPARGTRKTLIVALARKLLIELWRYLTTGAIPAGAVLSSTR